MIGNTRGNLLWTIRFAAAGMDVGRGHHTGPHCRDPHALVSEFLAEPDRQVLTAAFVAASSTYSPGLPLQAAPDDTLRSTYLYCRIRVDILFEVLREHR